MERFLKFSSLFALIGKKKKKNIDSSRIEETVSQFHSTLQKFRKSFRVTIFATLPQGR